MNARPVLDLPPCGAGSQLQAAVFYPEAPGRRDVPWDPATTGPPPRGGGGGYPRNTAAPHIPQPSPPHTAFTAVSPSAPQHYNSFCQRFLPPPTKPPGCRHPRLTRDHGNGRGDKLEDRRGLGGLPGLSGWSRFNDVLLSAASVDSNRQ